MGIPALFPAKDVRGVYAQKRAHARLGCVICAGKKNSRQGAGILFNGVDQVSAHVPGID